MSIESEVARVGAILRADIEAAKASGLRMIRNEFFAYEKADRVGCCALGACAIRIVPDELFPNVEQLAPLLGICDDATGWIAAGFDGDRVEPLSPEMGHWYELGRTLAAAAGLPLL